MNRLQCNSKSSMLIAQSSIYIPHRNNCATLSRQFVNKAAGNELFWVYLAVKSTAMCWQPEYEKFLENLTDCSAVMLLIYRINDI